MSRTWCRLAAGTLRPITFTVALAAAVAAGSAPAFAQTRTSCSILGQNLFVRDAMEEYYYWYRELPPLNPARYRSPEAYLDALRYRPLDESFSYIGSREADQAFYSNSQFIGFGFSSAWDGAELRVTQAFPDSPAAEAGLTRGERIVAIGGRSVFDLVQSGQLNAALGPSQEGFAADFVIQAADGGRREVRMVKRVVTIPTVSAATVFEVDGRPVGYLVFRNFVEPSIAALDEAFARFRETGVRDVVIDLRYNGGGLVSVAHHLAGLLGGKLAEGQVFAESFHNDKNAFRNEQLRFEAKAESLTLDRVIAITTRSSASASELVINGLRPFIPVVVVGDTTFGKPVGQYGFTFCDKVLYAVAFTMRNADGYGDYFGGIPADCVAADDLDHQFGDPAEASLAEALHVARTGTCSTPPTATARRAPSPREPMFRDGFQQLVGAW